MKDSGLLEQIKKRLLISSVVRPAVNLRGTGPNFIGLCPFHEEKTPSFHVRDNLGRFKCFGCGASGDIIEFVMKLRGLSFSEAMAELAESAGINPIKALPAKVVNKSMDLLRAQSIAQEYFVKELKESSGRKAYEYLKARGLTAEMIAQGSLGFGGTGESFLAHLAKRGVSVPCALKAGLIKSGGTLTPWFSGRITFPIRNFAGQIIAFGARAMPDDEGAKYVNTHNYEHYEKRKNFYGIFESKAAILKGQAPVLVEGYFDAMAFWAIGIPALALCGTALSPEHASIIKRLSSRLILCFDADRAGVLALRNSLMEIFNKEINPSLILLNEKDAGEYLAKGELSKLKDGLAQKTDALCFLIDKAAEQGRSDIAERIKQIDWLVPVLSLLKRPLVRRQYVAYLAKALHEDPALLWWEIGKKLPKDKGLAALKTDNFSLSAQERLLLRLILADASSWSKIEDLLPKGEVRDVFSLFNEFKEPQEIKAKILSLYPQIWPAVLGVLEDPIEVSQEEAQSQIEAIRKKNEGQLIKAALKQKGLELEQLEKKKDFSKAIAILKEKSAMLSQSKPQEEVLEEKKKAEPKPKPQLKPQPKPQPLPSVAREKPASEEQYFDPSEDWF